MKHCYRLLIAVLLLAGPGCATKTYHEKMAATDWLLAGSVLFALMPAAGKLSFNQYIGVFLLAQLAGLVSQVPGGLGVFESFFILLVPARVPRSALLGVLIVYRGIYYLLPLMAATIALGLLELARHQAVLVRAKNLAGELLSRLFIPLISLAVFVAGGLFFRTTKRKFADIL